ncbi:MAG: PAS domain-containing sensor histidine kinase [Methylobacter sp.]|nr:MAG: PAS domain-containing sensor histidine kinase [Methylobacter sp.]
MSLKKSTFIAMNLRKTGNIFLLCAKKVGFSTMKERLAACYLPLLLLSPPIFADTPARPLQANNFDFLGLHPNSYDVQRLYSWLHGELFLLALLALFSAYVVYSRHKLSLAKSTLDKLVRNAPGMTYQFQLNADGGCSMPFASKNITDVFGIDAKTVKHDATAIFALSHPDDLEYLWQSIRYSAQKMTDWNEQFRVIHPQKGEIWMEGHSTPERLSNGAVLWHGFIRDITHRKRVEQTLKNSEARFRQMFDHSPVAYQSLDIDGCYLDLNDKMADMLGYSRQELLGRCFGDFWLETPKEPFPLMFDNLKSAQHVSSELQLRRKDGSAITVLIDSSIQRDFNDSFMRTHCILWDISERKQLEDMLIEAKIAAENANKAKSDFLSHISHELRTPLSAIIGFGQLLEIGELAPLADVQKKAVGHIMTSSRHLLSLINEILDMARIESGKTDFKIETIALLPLIDEAVSLSLPAATPRNVVIQYSCPSNIHLRADLSRVRQVLLNLLSNAIKYNRQDGNVTLFCTVAGNFVQVTVSDTGHGIANERRQEIFQAFHRLGAERSNIEGTGIGLVICKRLIEGMGGRIDFDSAPDIGSRFWFELPVAGPDNQIAVASSFTEKEEASTEQRTTVRHVLYIEDNPVNLEIMKHVFKTHRDIDLLSAESAEIGLEMIHENRPDLVLMDINLPGISGLDALHRLKANPDTASIPVIAVSATAMPCDVETGLKAGFLAYLTKPFDIAKLNAIIKENI